MLKVFGTKPSSLGLYAALSFGILGNPAHLLAQPEEGLPAVKASCPFEIENRLPAEQFATQEPTAGWQSYSLSRLELLPGPNDPEGTPRRARVLFEVESQIPPPGEIRAPVLPAYAIEGMLELRFTPLRDAQGKVHAPEVFLCTPLLASAEHLAFDKSSQLEGKPTGTYLFAREFDLSPLGNPALRHLPEGTYQVSLRVAARLGDKRYRIPGSPDDHLTVEYRTQLEPGGFLGTRDFRPNRVRLGIENRGTRPLDRPELTFQPPVGHAPLVLTLDEDLLPGKNTQVEVQFPFDEENPQIQGDVSVFFRENLEGAKDRIFRILKVRPEGKNLIPPPPEPHDLAVEGVRARVTQRREEAAGIEVRHVVLEATISNRGPGVFPGDNPEARAQGLWTHPNLTAISDSPEISLRSLGKPGSSIQVEWEVATLSDLETLQGSFELTREGAEPDLDPSNDRLDFQVEVEDLEDPEVGQGSSLTLVETSLELDPPFDLNFLENPRARAGIMRLKFKVRNEGIDVDDVQVRFRPRNHQPRDLERMSFPYSGAPRVEGNSVLFSVGPLASQETSELFTFAIDMKVDQWLAEGETGRREYPFDVEITRTNRGENELLSSTSTTIHDFQPVPFVDRPLPMPGLSIQSIRAGFSPLVGQMPAPEPGSNFGPVPVAANRVTYTLFRLVNTTDAPIDLSQEDYRVALQDADLLHPLPTDPARLADVPSLPAAEGPVPLLELALQPDRTVLERGESADFLLAQRMACSYWHVPLYSNGHELQILSPQEDPAVTPRNKRRFQTQVRSLEDPEGETSSDFQSHANLCPFP